MDEQKELSAPVEAVRVFDASKNFLVPTSGGRKKFKVRFPTDAELCKRSRDLRHVRHDLGRDKSKTETPNTSAVAVELFQKIQVAGDGPEFDAADATEVVRKIDLSEVTDYERTGENARVTLIVPGAETVHVVRMPWERETQEYSRSAVGVVRGRRSDEIRVTLEPSGVLYDKIAISTEGYAGRVPINHKSAVVQEVLAQLSANSEDDVVPED
jgi:hypothetical protein